ncbi:MAG: SurA N-terminal domain-containing protein [Proteobacteria bacterium]|nr:SurA N-terminal domain-containing protein [Pseudomonadota bacterium]MBU1397379.1 SurA N-terminal domain-containing protein [Pseudomonadota bacterium]MBU1571163.1 SurA N-terminal domain-containing protein [Pseudomonadota bacterium]
MHKYNKILTLIFFLILSGSYAYSGTNSAEVVDRVVAVVNEEIISLSELSSAVNPYAERMKSLGYPPEKEREMLFKVREDMLEQLINQKLTDQESKKYSISVSEKELDNAIERVKEVNHYTDEDLRSMLAKEGMSMEGYRNKVKEHLIRSKLLNFAVKSKIIITGDEIKSYYNSNIEKYRGEKTYNLKNMVKRVGLSVSDGEKQNIRSKMEEIYNKLKMGQIFEDVGKEYADSEFDVKNLDLGMFKYNELSPEIQEAIKGLKAGDFTKVVETEVGYQIVYIEKIEEKPDKSLEEVTPEIQDILFGEVVERKFESWIGDLRQKSHIKVIK